MSNPQNPVKTFTALLLFMLCAFALLSAFGLLLPKLRVGPGPAVPLSPTEPHRSRSYADEFGK